MARVRLLEMVLALAVVGCGGSLAASPTPGATPASPSVLGGETAAARDIVTASLPPTASPAPKASRVVITPGPKMDRWLFTATKLADGRILVSGGYTLADEKKACSHLKGSACSLPTTATAEIYDPRTKSFAPTGSMTRPRILHQAVLLRDGRVLVIGGRDDPTTAEIYDPATGRFRDLGDMHQDISGDAGPIYSPAPSVLAGLKVLERQIVGQAVTVLADGRVLIAGGQDVAGDSSNAVTIFDPTTNSFSNEPGMPNPWKDVSASLLPDGRVLFTGGVDTSTYSTLYDTFKTTRLAWLFDPATNSFSRTGNTQIARDGGSQVSLRDGRVLVVGGLLDPTVPGCGGPIEAEVYDTPTGRFSPVGGMNPPWVTTPVLVPDGRALLLGGYTLDCADYGHDVEAYDPESGFVSLVAPGVLPGIVDDAFALDDGSILLMVHLNEGSGDRVYFMTLE
jgi:Kelch motif/Galactose oxidase, central domain